MAEGGDPIGVTLEEPYLIKLGAANAIVDGQIREVIQGPDAQGL